MSCCFESESVMMLFDVDMLSSPRVNSWMDWGWLRCSVTKKQQQKTTSCVYSRMTMVDAH